MMLKRRINRLMGTIVLTLATCALVACSSNDSSSSSPEENPAEDSSESSSDPRSDKNSSGVVVLDSLGRPQSSSGVGQGGSSTGLSSSSVGPVIGIEDTVITDTTVVTDVNALPDCSAEIEGVSVWAVTGSKRKWWPRFPRSVAATVC